LIGRIIQGGLVLWVTVFGLSPVAALAGAFSVAPIRLEMAAGARTAALTVRNQEQTPMVVQVRAFDWTQRNGEDVLEETRDLIATPAVVTVAPGESQLVRVALRRPADRERELTYRLFVEEVPQQAGPGFVGLNVAVRMSLPVFVTTTGKASRDVRWTASRDDHDRIDLLAENVGNTHVQFAGLTLRHPDVDSDLTPERPGGYVLAGQTRRFTLSVPVSTLDGLSEIELSGYSDAGEVEVAIPLTRQ